MEWSRGVTLLFAVITCLDKSLTQELTLRFDPEGAVSVGSSLLLFCESSVPVTLDNVFLTLNGIRELERFSFVRGDPERQNFVIEFGTATVRADNNNLVAQCHFSTIGNSSSNADLVDVVGGDENKVTLLASSDERDLPTRNMSTGNKIIPRLNVVALQDLVITCGPNTDSTDNIILRLNGVDAEQFGSLSMSTSTDRVTNAKIFNINYLSVTDELNDMVVQCTQVIFGSNPFIMDITREVCGTCNREDKVFCQSSSRCLSFPSICECLMLCPEENICELCQESCDPNQYYCQSQANCIPFDRFCSPSVNCSCDKCGVCRSKCEQDNALYCPLQGDCIPLNDYCRTLPNCSSSCGVIDTCEVCGSICREDEFFCQSLLRCVAIEASCNQSIECKMPCTNLTCPGGKVSLSTILLATIIPSVGVIVTIILLLIVVGIWKFNKKEDEKDSVQLESMDKKNKEKTKDKERET